MRATILMAFCALLLAACDDDNEALERGVGAECGPELECTMEGQECLTMFKGGYCGERNCTGDVDCPSGSACITHEDGVNYCFLLCVDKPDCNYYRTVENEANCSSSVVFVDGADGRKACVPPSSGI